MDWSEISAIVTGALATVGVYVDGRIRSAVIAEKVKNIEKNIILHEKNVDNINHKIENMFEKIFDKLSQIEKELQLKANINHK